MVIMESKTLSELKQKEKEARRQLILNAAIELFSSQPVTKVSIRDIAKKAEISPALIYRHFDDRDELFVEAFVKQSENMISSFTKNVKDKEKGTLELEKVGEMFVTYLLDHDDFFQMMTHFMMDAVLKEKVLNDFNNNMRKLLATFDDSFQDNGVREQIRLHSQALFSALNGIVITYRNYPGRSEEEIREHIIKLATFICEKFKLRNDREDN